MDAVMRTAILAAIKAEEAAYSIYHKGYRLSPAPAERQLFRMLMRQELGHKKGLQQLLAGKKPTMPPPAKGLKMMESMSTTPLSELAGLVQILKFAVKKEQAAQQRYRRMVRMFNGSAKRMLVMFQAQEKQHEMMIKAELRKV